MKTVYIKPNKKLTDRKIKRIAKKLGKKNKVNEQLVVIPNELLNNLELINEIQSYNVQVLNGRWLFKFLLFDIIEYLSKKLDKNKEMLNIAILVINIDDVIIKQIIQIAEVVKNLKIITKYKSRLSYVEQKLYDTYGIAIQVTNNKDKAITNDDIIINIDLDETQIKEYNGFNDNIVVNIKYQINYISESFRGKIINYYRLNFKEEILKEFNHTNDYDYNALYESRVFRKDTFLNIKKQLSNDGIKLAELV